MSVTDFLQYQRAIERSKAAYNAYNHAGCALELAKIEERLAEIQSQHEPLHSLLLQGLTARERLVAAAHYVVVGRMPEREVTG